MEQANIELKTQLDEITLLEQKVREQAIRDALTGLFNRRYLSEILEGELSRAHRAGYQVAFLLADLDHFKSINDTCGHSAGDYVLQQAAHLIRENIRCSDIACRYGGEEFLIVMPEIRAEDALLRAENLRAAIQEMVITFEGKVIPLTASIGLALYPFDGQDSSTLFSAVDTAMYTAKRSGRNRVVQATHTHK